MSLDSTASGDIVLNGSVYPAQPRTDVLELGVVTTEAMGLISATSKNVGIPEKERYTSHDEHAAMHIPQHVLVYTNANWGTNEVFAYYNGQAHPHKADYTCVGVSFTGFSPSDLSTQKMAIALTGTFKLANNGFSTIGRGKLLSWRPPSTDPARQRSMICTPTTKGRLPAEMIGLNPSSADMTLSATIDEYYREFINITEQGLESGRETFADRVARVAKAAIIKESFALLLDGKKAIQLDDFISEMDTHLYALAEGREHPRLLYHQGVTLKSHLMNLTHRADFIGRIKKEDGTAANADVLRLEIGRSMAMFTMQVGYRIAANGKEILGLVLKGAAPGQFMEVYFGERQRSCM